MNQRSTNSSMCRSTIETLKQIQELMEDEDEDVEDEDPGHEEESEPEEPSYLLPTDYPFKCRSIRIGSFKVHPTENPPYNFVPVTLSENYMSFTAPMLTDGNKFVLVKISRNDINSMQVHFGKCLPIMFVYTTQKFAEVLRNKLRMTSPQGPFFDSKSKDEKTQKLTFLIEHITEEQRNFLRLAFPGDQKVKEIDQKTANEILVRSTPNTPFDKITPNCENASATSTPPTLKQNPALSGVASLPNISVTRIAAPPPQPQIIQKLLTYPAPPQTGGITVTTEDLQCLNEGEFLNDAIIDFYLKYVFYEKLTPQQREKTHIFSSFFYPRLTHKPERARAGDDQCNRTAVARRHNQVKTWTKNVDIFSKDFIVIPVNQTMHWFLAIICFPGKVPDAPPEPPQPRNPPVTSSDGDESGCKVVIKEISSNGDGDPSSPADENSNSNSAYEVEEPPDSDDPSPDTPDSSTHPDGKQRKEMPCICVFDSLTGPNRWRIPHTLREYLEMEWKSKKDSRKVFDRNTMQGFIMKCPQQTNYSDCGMYLLQCVESFFENPMPYFGNPMPDLTNWFSDTKISKKRLQLKELIIKIHKEQLTMRRQADHQSSQQGDR